MLILRKLAHSYIWKRIFFERLTEPLHLNILSVFILVFGSFRSKVAWDLVVRSHHAYSLLNAADQAKNLGLTKVTVVEFGVAAGAGLLNLVKIAEKVRRVTGISFEIYGFDTGKGMPVPRSFRDHPDLYQEGDFVMDIPSLKSKLPHNCHLVIGEVEVTVPEFVKTLSDEAPLGFVSVDVDYYYSAKQSLEVLRGASNKYLPRSLVYLDDLEDQAHNNYCGELLAVNEFNTENEFRKIERHQFLRSYRIFRNARWIDHIFTAHVLDHVKRSQLEQTRKKVILTNPYL